MRRNRSKPARPPKYETYDYPIVNGTLQRDALNRVADVIELLEQLDLADGLTPNAHAGLYWIHNLLAGEIRRVSDDLRRPDRLRTARNK